MELLGIDAAGRGLPALPPPCSRGESVTRMEFEVGPGRMVRLGVVGGAGVGDEHQEDRPARPRGPGDGAFAGGLPRGGGARRARPAHG